MRGYPRKDKNTAVEMRRNGKSYKEIKKALGIPKSTLSVWLSKENWSQKIRTVLEKRSAEQGRVRLAALDKIRGEHLARLYREARSEAVKEFEKFKYFPLFFTGIAIYWGEGDKGASGSVRLANTDPSMVKIFINFLRIICGVPLKKIRANILIYPDLDSQICINYWSDQIGLSRQNFTKCVTIQGRHKTRRLPYGVCMVNASSTYLKEKMKVWLALLPKELEKQSAGIV